MMTKAEVARIWIACELDPKGVCARDTLWNLACKSFGEKAMMPIRYVLICLCHEALCNMSVWNHRYRSGDPRYNLKRKVQTLMRKITTLDEADLHERFLPKKRAFNNPKRRKCKKKKAP